MGNEQIAINEFPKELIETFSEFVDICRYGKTSVLPVIHKVRRKTGKIAFLIGSMFHNPEDDTLYFKELGEIFPVGLDTTKIYDFDNAVDDKNTIFAE